MSDQILSKSAYSAVINAPIDRVDITDWLLNLPDARRNWAGNSSGR